MSEDHYEELGWREGEVDLQTYWRVLKRRREIFFAVFILSFSSVLFWTLTAPRRYEGEILLKMAVGREIPIVIDIPGLPTTTTDPFQTQMEILRSRALAERVARRLGLVIKPENASREELFEELEGTLPPGMYKLMVDSTHARLEGGRIRYTWPKDTALQLPDLRLRLKPGIAGIFHLKARPLSEVAGAIQNRLKVTQKGHTDLVTLKVTAESPQLAAEIANTYGEDYLAFVQEINKRAAVSVRAFIESQLEKVRQELQNQEKALADFKKREGLLTLEGTAQALVSRFSEIEARLQDAQLQEQEIQQTLQGQRDKLQALYGLEYPDHAASLVLPLRDRLTELEMEHQKLLSRYTEDHPEVQLLNRQIQNLQEEIRKAIRSDLIGVALSGDPVLEGLLSSLVEGEAQRVALRARQEALSTLLQEVQNQMRLFPEKELRYMELAREVEASRALFRLLLQRLEEAKIAEAQETLDAGIIDRAYPKEKPVAPRVKANLFLGLILSLMFGIGAAFVVEYLDRSPQDPRQAEHILGAPALTLIPQVKDPETSLSFLEGIKGWASSLLLLTHRQGGVFAITSPLPEEGKSTLAEKLARYLAQIGQRVLLVDGDFRRPKLHTFFNLPYSPGLMDFLTGAEDLAGVLRPVEERLTFLPSGSPVDLRNGRVLFAHNFPTLWEQLHARFPWVLIDCSPIMASPELPTILQGITGVLLILRIGKTTEDSLREARRILNFAGIPIAGVVLNGLKRAHLYGGYEYRYVSSTHPPQPPARRFSWPWSRSSM